MVTATLEKVEDYIEVNLVHSIHVSERKSFRGCRRRWSWIYRDLYYPQTTAKPLEFGIAYHAAAEHWYNPDFWGIDDESREVETLELFKQKCEQQMREYRDKHLEPGETLDDEVRLDYLERVELGQGMLRQMFKMSYEIDQEYRPVGVEVPFEVPIKLKDQQLWCKCRRCWKRWMASEYGKADYEYCLALPDATEAEYRNGLWHGLPVTLGGRIDCLFRDKFGRIWIVDWKTAARLSTGEAGSPDDYLWLDDQITSYCYALWLLGIDVAGFIYHEQKKTISTEPEPLTRRWKGALYSQNKGNGYDYATYKKTVEENDAVAYANGVYDDFLAYLAENAAEFYKRHIISRNQDELVQAGINIALEAADLTDPGLRIYPNPGRFSCNNCAFREPCLGQNRGEDYLYTLDTLFEKRTKLYYETAEPNTDKPSLG